MDDDDLLNVARTVELELRLENERGARRARPPFRLFRRVPCHRGLPRH